MASTTPLHRSALQRFLAGLQPRERAAVGLAAAVLASYLLWAVALAPAWRTLQAAPARHQAADAQLAEVMALAQQAQALTGQRGAPSLSRPDAVRALEQATQQALGSGARLTISGNRATVGLTAVAPDALARWLAQARLNARLLPVEAQLQRSGDEAAWRWSGTVVLAGPALSDTP